MNFSEQPPSKQWAALKYKGEIIAEVWFKPDGDPSALTFRIPQESFHVPGMGRLLTAANLLGAVAIATDEVESWFLEGESPPSADGSNADMGQPLSPPPQNIPHLTVHVRLKPSPEAAAAKENGGPDFDSARRQDLEARWNVILGLEATIDGLRQRMESLRTEMEGSSRKMLTADEKVHALNADVVQWNKAKGRVHYTLPKVREFIHRATWALGLPERKQLEEMFEDPSRIPSSSSEMNKVRAQLENLLKDRQVLSAQGVAVCQECQGISADIQGALRTLQSNAAANARNKLAAARKKGKFI